MNRYLLLIGQRATIQAASLVCIILLLSTSSCKKDTPSPTGPSDQTPTRGTILISDHQRTLLFAALDTVISSLSGVDQNFDNQTLVAFMHSRSEFAAAGITPEGTVWARFTDGRQYVYSNYSSSSVGKIVVSPSVLPRLRKKSTVSYAGVPQQTTVRLLNSLGPAFDYTGFGMVGYTQTVQDLTDWFQAAGYTPVTGASASVDDLKGVAGDGVFYWSAHGARSINGSDTLYGVWTTTEYDSLWEMKYKRDLDSGCLIYFTAPHEKKIFGSDISKTHYAITKKFVQQYMSFGQNSIVFINACWSFDAMFREACKSKGAGIYLGWTNATEPHDAVKTARYYFDRTLGSNRQEPIESPNQRPFKSWEVLEDMYHKGLDITSTQKYGVARLQSDESINDEMSLVPSIEYGVVLPLVGNTDFFIEGAMGDDPGNRGIVWLGNSALPIHSWKSTRITCALPTHGGNLTVSVGGRKSNAVQLTEWHGTFDYVRTGRGTLKKHIVVNIQFLMDLHTVRLRCGQPPIWIPKAVQVLNTSSCTYECSGEYRDQNNNLVEAWSGSGSLPFYSQVTQSQWFFFAGGPDSTIGAAGDFDLTLMGKYTVTTSSGSYQANLGFEYSTGSHLPLTLDASYGFAAGSKTGGTAPTTATMTWNAMPALYPPDPNVSH